MPGGALPPLPKLQENSNPWENPFWAEAVASTGSGQQERRRSDEICPSQKGIQSFISIKQSRNNRTEEKYLNIIHLSYLMQCIRCQILSAWEKRVCRILIPVRKKSYLRYFTTGPRVSLYSEAVSIPYLLLRCCFPGKRSILYQNLILYL